ncbi:hypothetical protein AB0K78_04115, partial [Streptomyces albidoflavus]
MTSGDITAWSPPADARTVRPAPTATTRGEAPGESEPKGRVVVETPVARRERSALAPGYPQRAVRVLELADR